MKLVFSFFLSMICLTAISQTTTITPGASAPSFALPGVDGKETSFASFPNAKGYIIVFTCNTCPYAQAYEQRIIDLNTKYAPLGYPVIAINPNDPEVAVGDSFDAMKQRAKDKTYKFPYLFDKGQTTTNAYGAKATPHLFLVEKKNGANTIVYTGSIDNDPENNKPDKLKYLETAIESITSGHGPDTAVTKAIGCTVRRKKKA